MPEPTEAELDRWIQADPTGRLATMARENAAENWRVFHPEEAPKAPAPDEMARLQARVKKLEAKSGKIPKTFVVALANVLDENEARHEQKIRDLELQLGSVIRHIDPGAPKPASACRRGGCRHEASARPRGGRAAGRGLRRDAAR
jgi:hypothetical protein